MSRRRDWLRPGREEAAEPGKGSLRLLRCSNEIIAGSSETFSYDTGNSTTDVS